MGEQASNSCDVAYLPMFKPSYPSTEDDGEPNYLTDSSATLLLYSCSANTYRTGSPARNAARRLWSSIVSASARTSSAAWVNDRRACGWSPCARSRSPSAASICQRSLSKPNASAMAHAASRWAIAWLRSPADPASTARARSSCR